MFKVIITIIFIFSSFFSLYSQNTIENNSFDADLIAGSGVFCSNNFTGFNSYFSPSMSFALNPKLSISSGFITSATTFKSKNLKNTDYTTFRNYLYSQAQYKVNEKLQITGDIIYGTNVFQNNTTKNNKFNMTSYSFGAIYNVTDYLQLQFNVRQTNSSSPNFNETDNFFIK